MSKLLRWAATTIFLALLGLAVLERQDLSPTSQPLFNEMVEFHGPLKVGQSFVASRSGLCRVALLLARKGRTNRSPVVFHLREGAEATADLATATISASHLEDVTTMVRRPYVYQSFSFPPIPDSVEKTFYFWVESPQSPADDPLLARYQAGNVYPEGTMSIDDAAISGDLAFKVYYAKGFPDNATLLLERLVEHRPFPWNSKAFYVAIFVVYLMLFADLMHKL
ncbi:TPA: hypothetical protein EYP12_08345 [Candidatus Bipolaricaulota bacterium]|nr:hypothetical protein [Candidatus Bipolaricaulota bacterium]